MKIYYCDELEENLVTFDELDATLIKGKKVESVVKDFRKMGFNRISLIKLDVTKFERARYSFGI